MASTASSSTNVPGMKTYDFPQGRVDPNINERLMIGNRISLLKNFDEHKNAAIASLVSSVIFLVGGTILSFMASPVLGSLMISSAVILGTGGSLFFVIKKYLDPKLKIESDKEELRFTLFQKILQYKTNRLEGYDLLEKAISDRSADPEDKAKLYICVRQLKRQLEKIKEKKLQYRKDIELQYKTAIKKLEDNRDKQVGNLHSITEEVERNYHKFQIEKRFNQEIDLFDEWKVRAIKALDDQFEKAVNGLNIQYDNFLKRLGMPEEEAEPEVQSWKGFLWDATKSCSGYLAGKFPWGQTAE